MDCHVLKGFYDGGKKDEVIKIVDKVSKEICNKTLEIVDLIANLRMLLVSESKQERYNGVDFLSSVLQRVDKDHLNEQQIKCLFDFYMDRANDDTNILEPVANGLSALIQHKNFTHASAELLIHKLQSGIAFRLCHSNVRKVYYSIVDDLFTRFKTEFSSSGARFLFAFLAIVDNETSSSLLKEVFDLYAKIAKIPQFLPFKEDIFDALAGYFPIMYSKETDPNVLSVKTRIHQSLVQALTSTVDYYEFAFSLAFEKMESISVQSKVSSYDLILNMFVDIDYLKLQPFLRDLWTNIRVDSMKQNTNDDEDLIARALQTLQCMGSVCDCDELDQDRSSLFDRIWTDLKVPLQSPSLRLAIPAAKMFAMFADKCKIFASNHYVKCCELIFESFLSTDDVPEKKDCVEAFVIVVQMRNRSTKENFSDEDSMFARRIPMLLDNSLGFPATGFLSELIDALCKIPQAFYSEGMIKDIANFLSKIRQKTDFSVVENEYLVAVEVFAHICPSAMTEHYVNPLLDSLHPQQPSFVLDSEAILSLRALLVAARQPSVFSSLCQFLLEFSDKLSTVSDKNRYYSLVFETSTKDSPLCNRDQYQRDYLQIFASRFFRPFLEKLFGDVFEKQMVLSTHTLLYLMRTVKILLNTVEDFAKDFAVEELVLKNNLSQLLPKDSVNEPLKEKLRGLDLSTANECRIELYLLISNAFISQSQSEGNVVTKLLTDSRILCSRSEFDANIRRHLEILLENNILAAACRNESDNDFDNVTNKVMEHICNSDDGSLSSPFKTSLLFGLFIVFSHRKNAAQSNRYFKLFLERWNDENFREVFVSSMITNIRWFDIAYAGIVSPIIDYCPTGSAHQKNALEFSVEVAMIITDRFKSVNSESLFSLLIQYYSHAPEDRFKEIISQEFVSEFLPIILDGMKKYVGAPKTVSLCIQFLNTILKEDPSILSTYVLRIFKACVECSTIAYHLRTRREALLLLSSLVHALRSDCQLLDAKSELLSVVRPTLSDRKRLVRTVAAEVNIKLCMLGQPGN